MEKEVAIEIVKIVPTVFALLIFFTLIVRYRRQLDNLLSRAGRIKAFGVEAEFAQVKDQLKNAAKSYNLTPNEAEFKKVIERASRLRDLLSNSRILWVDDRPLTNASIFRFLNNYGVVIDTTKSTEEALDALELASGAYDVVITDMVREGQTTAGLDLIRGMEERKIKKPVIIFVAQLDPDKGVPRGAEAITNSPITLIHEVMDALERLD
jgi:CheY-like chemotaxis protein